jgi:tRNA(Glu) U13 pseudouridine synthase TruD
MNAIKIGDVTGTEKAIKLGSLNGNRFSIALRFIEASDK